MKARFLQAILLWVAVSITAVPQALAHAVLIEASPADGARLNEPPAAVRLTFSEPVRPSAIRVLGPDGALETGPDSVSVSNKTVRIDLPRLASGSHVVSYRVISADGHPVSGSVVFAIGAGAASTARPAAAPDENLLAAVSAGNRAVQYAAVVGAAGGALFLLLVLGNAHPLAGRLRDGLCGLIILAAASAVLAVGLGGAHLTGGSVANLLTTEAWAAGLTTSVHGSAAALLGGALLLAFGLALRRPFYAVAALGLGALITVASLALTGHAATAPPRALSAPAVFLHGLAAAFWIGALWPLLAVLRATGPSEAHGVVVRFSRIAAGAVAALVATGILLSLVQITAPAQIPATPYGRIWAVKIAFVLLLLGLAALNRQVLTARLAWPDPSAAALRRSIAAELACAAAILAATALLGQTPPPRALVAHAEAGHAHHPASQHHAPPHGRHVEAVTSAQGVTARLALDPGVAGRNRAVVTLTDGSGRPVAARDVTVSWSLAAAGIEPIERRIPADGDGRFAGEIDLPAPGVWSVRIDALVSDFEKIVLRADVVVAAPEDTS